MKKSIFSFGEVLWDLLPGQRILGGAPFNFVYRVNSLGDTGYMVSRLGRDLLGEEAFEKIKSLDLDTRFIQWDERHPTGTVKVSFDTANNPDFVILPGVAYDYIEHTPELLKSVAKADCLYFGTLTQRAETSQKTLQKLLEAAKQCVKFLDMNLRKDCFSKESIKFSLKQADILKLNEDEARFLADIFNYSFISIPLFCEEMINKWNLRFCLVTLAEKGAFAASQTGESVYCPGYNINFVDSVGAGDAFSAGFVFKLLKGSSFQQGCQFGNILGALVATQTGATTKLTPETIENFLSQKNQRHIHSDLKSFIRLID